METYRGERGRDQNVENRVTAESSPPLSSCLKKLCSYFCYSQRNFTKFFFLDRKRNKEQTYFFFFYFSTFYTLSLNQRRPRSMVRATVNQPRSLQRERRSTGAWGKYGRTNGLPDTMDQRNIVGERGRSAANTHPIVPPEIITDYPDRF